MWIELLKDAGGLKAGFHDIADEAAARGYIAAGLAKEAGDGPDKIILQRSLTALRTELSGITRSIADDITAVAGEVRGRGVHIQAGESEADRTAGLGDYIRQIYYADPRYPHMAQDRDGAEKRSTAARERLDKVYHKRSTGALSGNNLAGGGALTPISYEAMLLKETPEDIVIARGCREVPMTERGANYPALDQYQAPAAGQSAFYGGVQVFRKTEQAQRTSTQPGFKSIELVAKDLTALAPIPRDLLEDASIPVDGLCKELIGGAIAWREDWECLNGTGSGQMLGLYNAPSTMFIARNTGGSIKYQDIFTMWSRLFSGAKAGACWLVHPYSTPALLQIQDPSGKFIMLPYTAAGPEAALGAAPSYKMLGLGVIETEKVPVLGSTGDLTLTNRKRYLLGRRSGSTEMTVSDQFYFDTDRIGIRAKLRNDGAPQLLKAITLADGSSQVSSTVVLQ